MGSCFFVLIAQEVISHTLQFSHRRAKDPKNYDHLDVKRSKTIHEVYLRFLFFRHCTTCCSYTMVFRVLIPCRYSNKMQAVDKRFDILDLDNMEVFSLCYFFYVKLGNTICGLSNHAVRRVVSYREGWGRGKGDA